MHRAASKDNIEALKLLLNVPSIDVDIVDREGLSALHRAVNSANWKLLFNFPNINVNIALLQLCEKGDLEGVKTALQRGADINSKEKYETSFANVNIEKDKTGLMHAVRYKNNSVVALLLKTPNIDVNQRDDYRRCALHWAVTKENNEALKLLLNAPGVDVNIVDNSRKSVLHRAVLADNIEALELLLNVPNIDVNIVDSYGENAVHRSAIKDNIWALKMLLHHPGLTALTLNQKNWRGDTPVILALKRKKFDHLALLAAVPRVDFD